MLFFKIDFFDFVFGRRYEGYLEIGLCGGEKIYIDDLRTAIYEILYNFNPLIITLSLS